jgi:hypothetical protein
MPDNTKPKTLDQARQRIAELEAQLAGKTPVTVAFSAAQKVVKPNALREVAKTIGKTSKEIIASSLPLALADKIAALKAVLESESDPNKRLLSLTNAEKDLRTIASKEKDPVQQVAITRSLSKVQKRYALELFQNKEAWAKRNQVIDADLD